MSYLREVTVGERPYCHSERKDTLHCHSEQKDPPILSFRARRSRVEESICFPPRSDTFNLQPIFFPLHTSSFPPLLFSCFPIYYLGAGCPLRSRNLKPPLPIFFFSSSTYLIFPHFGRQQKPGAENPSLNLSRGIKLPTYLTYAAG